MKKVAKKIILIAGILAILALLPFGILMATSLTGLESLLSLNRTGVSDAWFAMTRSGVVESRLIIGTGFVQIFAPTDLTLTYVSDYEIHISWAKGVNAHYSMVRGAVGRIPEDRTDGYLVYYGTATNCTDYTAKAGETVIYYRVWSQSEAEVWEDDGVSGSIGGVAVALIVLGILAVGLTVTMFATRNMLLGFPAGIFWAIHGGFAYQQSTQTWDWQYLLFFASIGMTIFSIYAAFALRKSDLAGPDTDEEERKEATEHDEAEHSEEEQEGG